MKPCDYCGREDYEPWQTWFNTLPGLKDTMYCSVACSEAAGTRAKIKKEKLAKIEERLAILRRKLEHFERRGK